AAGCVDHFSTPSAYNSQIFLCDDAHAAEFAARVQTCAANAGCGGVFSMQGKLQSEPMTVDTLLTDGAYSIVQAPGTVERFLDEARMSGSSPYFDFVFHLKSVGGTLDMPTTTSRTLNINGGAPALTGSLGDTEVDVGQLLEAGGASAEEHAFTDSGSVLITFQSLQELRGTFAGAFGQSDDTVTGCFDMFALHSTTNPKPAM
ncbi:MAG TPA: hypothetical protein VF334_16620, partial [Polyangia bacterium]